jgi:hypothetical protein
MNKIVYVFITLAVLTSCADSYSVQGFSSVSSLDGSKLYLKAIKGNELKNIDSCEVVHGQFRFAGLLDTVRMANLFMDDHSIMPMVLEEGEISIQLDNAKQVVGGTPLNDRLYEFLDFHNQLTNEMAELSHRQSQMLLDGIDEDQINEQLEGEAAIIANREDSLVTNFIVENFDNILGPGVFMMLTSGFPYPVLTPQIEHIMSKATAKFKSDPYVREYYQVAQENEARQTGLRDVPQQTDPEQTDEPETMVGPSLTLPGDTSSLFQSPDFGTEP